MRITPSFLLLFLLLKSPSAPLHAEPGFYTSDVLTDTEAEQVCRLAAAQLGESPATLFCDYQAGRIILTDLGPVPGGRRYALQRADSDFVIIVDVTGV